MKFSLISDFPVQKVLALYKIIPFLLIYLVLYFFMVTKFQNSHKLFFLVQKILCQLEFQNNINIQTVLQILSFFKFKNEMQNFNAELKYSNKIC